MTFWLAQKTSTLTLRVNTEGPVMQLDRRPGDNKSKLTWRNEGDGKNNYHSGGVTWSFESNPHPVLVKTFNNLIGSPSWP